MMKIFLQEMASAGRFTTSPWVRRFVPTASRRTKPNAKAALQRADWWCLPPA